MNQITIQHYTSKLATLTRGNTPAGPAPHKPILLLSILEWVSTQTPKPEKILLHEDLFALFSKNWETLVTTKNRKNIFLPLHHLDDGTGWQLISKGRLPILKKISSFKRLEAEVAYGEFDPIFTKLIQDDELRFLFINVLLDTYFPSTRKNYWKANTSQPLYPMQQKIETQILEESKVKYWTKERKPKLQFFRDWKFTSLVKEKYKNACCISKLNMEPSYGIIEACHILPHAEFGNDSINNGIALCVNLHRAFDSGLLSIGKDYEVIFNKKKVFQESDSPYNLRQFESQKILLPADEKLYPSQEYLGWHRKEHQF